MPLEFDESAFASVVAHEIIPLPPENNAHKNCLSVFDLIL